MDLTSPAPQTGEKDEAVREQQGLVSRILFHAALLLNMSLAVGNCYKAI